VDPAKTFLLSVEVARIRTLPPFDDVPEVRLGELLAHCDMVFFRRGETILHPEIALPAPALWIVRQGSVCATGFDPTLAFLGADERIEVGGMFPLESVLGRGEGGRIYSAEEDCFLWRVEGEEIARWLAEPALMRWIALRLLDDQVRVRQAAVELVRARHHADQALAMPARSIGAPEVICVSTGQAIADVAALMAERGIGSVVVGSPAAVDGIVTHTDLVARGLAARMPHDTPVAQLMTPAPRMIDDSASVLEAGVELAQSHFRHLLLRSAEGPVVGVVSERDIFHAQQRGMAHVFTPIDEARSIAELSDLSHEVRRFGERMFRQGMEVGQFMRLMSSMNDRISRRLLQVIGGGRESVAPFCWLAFGSEAREEQGFVTDQDNGIVFDPPESADGARVEAIRSDLLAFAQQANDALDACGFERCKGNIMAGNPELCLSLAEWKAKISGWIRSTTPKALLNATIFFDMRAVSGSEQLAESLLDHLLAQSKGNTIFLHHMAVNALEVAPPVGRLNRFSTDGGRHRGTIDLKTQGSRLFVDVARIYALANGVRGANTVERLRVVGQRIKRSVSSIEGDIAAFRFIQSVRLRRQLDSLRGGGDANRINPYALDELRQRFLREALRQATSLQERLKLDYCP